MKQKEERRVHDSLFSYGVFLFLEFHILIEGLLMEQYIFTIEHRLYFQLTPSFNSSKPIWLNAILSHLTG